MNRCAHLLLVLSAACTYRTYLHEEDRPANLHEPWPNEPEGFQALSDWPQDAIEGGGWANADPGSISSGRVAIVSDSSAPVSPDNVMQLWFEEGSAAGAAPANVGFPLSGPRELYIGSWWKVSDPWESFPSGYFALWQLNPGLDMFMNGTDRSLDVQIIFPDDTREVGPNVEDVGVSLDEWHRVEMYARYSTTSGAADGIFRWWLDGVLLGDYTDIIYSDTPGFDQFFIYPGATLGDPDRTQEGYLWFDHIRISAP